MSEATNRPVAALLGIGGAAGAFSAMFGVGGGVIIVPLLVLWRGYDTRLATATSLAAIVPVAVWGAASHAVLGNVDVLRAALVGIPAMAGVMLGVRLKARLGSVRLTYAFAAFLLVIAGLMAAGV